MRIVDQWLAPLVVVGLVALGSQPFFQDQDENSDDIEIVDQDGRRVVKKSIRWSSDQGGDVNVQVDDGKIVIVDQDGKRREIDVSGAKNIIVNKSVQSIIRDGEEEKKIAGKAIIVGPDGTRQEIDLGDGVGEFAFGFNHPLALGFDENGKVPENLFLGATGGGRYMIGVNCSPVSAQLRAHLDLEEGRGLVVDSEPRDDSPAEEAGIERHDILVTADKNVLASVEDLVKAVQAAGKDKRAISMTLIRRGKELGVDVTPTERKSAGAARALLVPGLPGQDNLDFRFEKFGPGVLLENKDLMEQMRTEIEALRNEMEELRAMRMELQEKSRRRGRDKNE